MVDMYTSVGQHDGTGDQLGSQSIWNNEYDKDFSKLLDSSFLQQLDDLPRATSAPPHLQDRLNTASVDTGRTSSRLTPVESFTDIRFDEDYAAFYERYANERKLPPPVDGGTLYTDLQSYAQQIKDASMLHPASTSRLGNLGQGGPGQTQSGLLQTGLSLGGLEPVQEQQPSARNAVPDSVIHALSQLQMGAGSPAPPTNRPGSQPPFMGLGGLSPSPGPLAGQGVSPFEAAIAAGVGATRSASAFAAVSVAPTPPPISPSPPILNTSSPSVNQANSIGAMLQGSARNFRNSGNFVQGGAAGAGPGVPLANSIEYQAAYQAAYEVALMQSVRNLEHVQLPPGGGGLGLAGQNMGQTQGIPGYNPAAGNAAVSAAAAAAAMAVAAAIEQGSAAAAKGGEGNFEKEDRRGKRFQRNRDRERDREHHYDYYDSQYSRFSNLEEVLGQVMQVAQDQNGCRFLQRKFDEGGAAAVGVVFDEILENIVELMKDPFGNYLVQKLLDRCSEEQRTQLCAQVVKTVAERGELVTVALSTHGTRAVQKLIETLSTKEQRQMVIEALKPGVVSLIKDLNGNHVVQRCLQRLGAEDSQFIYDAACTYCVEVASHRHGCCVLQRCIDFATPQQRRRLVEEIARNALVLSQDAFGNYVVQYVLDLGRSESSQAIMLMLQGHYAELAMQKFSSNVVEKCLKLVGLDDARERIVREIMLSPSLPRLLQDPYGNYVIQSALTVTSGQLHQALVECIRPYLPSLRGTPHGKRILQKVTASLKKDGEPAWKMIGNF